MEIGAGFQSRAPHSLLYVLATDVPSNFTIEDDEDYTMLESDESAGVRWSLQALQRF